MGDSPRKKRGPGELVIFPKDHLLQVQEWLILLSGISSKCSVQKLSGRGPGQLALGDPT